MIVNREKKGKKMREYKTLGGKLNWMAQQWRPHLTKKKIIWAGSIKKGSQKIWENTPQDHSEIKEWESKGCAWGNE